jgi:hypothetical protein
MTRSALDVVTVEVGPEDGEHLSRKPVREYLRRMRAQEQREPMETLDAAISVYRVATATSYPPLKLVPGTLRISPSRASLQ